MSDTKPCLKPGGEGYNLLSADRKELRLIKLRSHNEQADLCFDMYVAELDQPPKYCALSYPWGAPVPARAMKEILIDGVSFKIRPILYFFLQYMAGRHWDKSMWVDTICINQDNTQERNAQVSLMGEIYRRARDVYAWLGPGDDDFDYAFDHLRNIESPTPFDENVFSMCIEKLFKATYWTRRWIIQEFALAEVLYIVCGDRQIDWNDLVRRVDVKMLEGDAAALQTLEAFREVRSLSSRRVNLLELMDRFRSARCGVWQDRAYALRSIADNGHRLLPDYNESKGDFFFRQLSMLPTERVLPEMLGYRWPHKDIVRLLNHFPMTKHDLLNSAISNPDDRMHVCLEYYGRVERVKQDLLADHREMGDLLESAHETLVCCDDYEKRYLLGSGDLIPGDLVYTLGMTPNSPIGLFIAFGRDPVDACPLGLLLQGPYRNLLNSWTGITLNRNTVMQIEQIVLRGTVMCSQNPSNRTSDRILCHINRSMLVMLWLLDLRDVDGLLRGLQLESGVVWKTQCDCSRNKQNVPLPRAENTERESHHLETLPPPWSTDGASDWMIASNEPWWGPTTKLLRQPYDMSQMWLSQRPSRRPSRRLSYREPRFSYDPYVDTELSYAARRGYFLWAQRLVSTRISSIDLADKYGRTPLRWAAYGGHDQIAQLLLSTGKVTCDTADIDKLTPLCLASRNGHSRTIQVLLEAGANVKLGCSNGDSLIQASSNGHLEAVRLLLEHGADVEARGGYHGSALGAALARNSLDVARLLIEHVADVNAQGGEYGNPLQIASRYGRLEIVQLLLEKGANINAQGGKYGTALQAAAADKVHEIALEIAQFLLEKGANVHAQGGCYGSALRAAVRCGSLGMVQLLLKNGADPNAHLEGHDHLLTETSQPEIAKVLREYGASSLSVWFRTKKKKNRLDSYG